MRDKIPSRQLGAWLFTAMVPPLIQVAGGASWAWLLGLGAVCILLNWLRLRWGGAEIAKWLRLPVFLLAAVVLGELAAESAGSWPGSNSFPAVPLILLALAAWSAAKGPQAAARVGAVLFWFIIIMYMLVFAAGVKQVRWQWLAPVHRIPGGLSAVVLLAPAAAAYLPIQRKQTVGKQIFGLLMAVAALVLIQGVLSPKAGVEHPFHEMSRSLELLGIAQRFEALICAAATVGWFALLALILSVCGEILVKGHWVGAAGAALWVLCGLHISGWVLAMLCAVFWVGLPILTQGLGKIKKS